MTEAVNRRILSHISWPDNQVVADAEALLTRFDCARLEDLEDHLFGLLPEDPGGVRVYADEDNVTIATGQVAMWSLTFPFDGDSFDAYLFELDERATLQNVLDQLPDEDDWIAEGRSDFTPKMAWLLRTTPEEFRAALGDGWHPLDLDWVGSTSNPSHFFWTGSAIVGLDNCNAYVFRETDSELGHELNGKHYQEVAWTADIWDAGSLHFEWFSPFVRNALADEPRGSCPTCGSGEVIHVLFGFPAQPAALPTWVRLGGCVIEGQVLDRACDACGHEWRSATAE